MLLIIDSTSLMCKVACKAIHQRVITTPLLTHLSSVLLFETFCTWFAHISLEIICNVRTVWDSRTLKIVESTQHQRHQIQGSPKDQQDNRSYPLVKKTRLWIFLFGFGLVWTNSSFKLANVLYDYQMWTKLC